MIRSIALAAGLLAVIALVAIPVPALMDAREVAEAADLAAAQDTVRPLAAPAAAIPDVDVEVITVRRVAGDLVAPVRSARVDAAGSELAARLSVADPGCVAIRLDGRVIASTGTTAAVIPASVQKILTAAAALDVLGPDGQLVTRLAGAEPVDGVVAGDLHVIGGGDPMLAEQRYADAYRRQPQLLTPLASIVAALRAAGVQRVDGAVVVHDDRYDQIRYVESWPQRYFDQHNAGPTGALTVNDGFLTWDPARSEADDPALYAGTAIRSALRTDGIAVTGGVRRAQPVDEIDTLPVLGEVPSPTVGEIVQQMLRESDNNTAESLLKELGHRRDGVGSTAGGAAAVVEAVAARGIDVSDLTVVDGSGLDRGNLVSCDALAELLEQFGPDSVLGRGLAVAAESGTLAHRFADTDVAGRLRAKTGLLNNVNGLAGFVETLDGNVLTFVQLQNGVPLNSREGLELQEALAATLVDVVAGESADELAEAIEALGLS